jgi:chromosome segregation ATPase
MKIVKLVAENVKRLHAVEITPEGALITIGGKNGAGKSSVLDSIAYALGGERLVPSEPIREGEAEAKIVVDLGDLVVTRRFKREKIVVAASVLSGQPGDFVPEQKTWSETKSTLTVTNKDGAKYPSPQAVLDKLLGKLTFDPLAFAREEPKRQDEILRKLVGLDLSDHDERRKNAAAQRALLKQSYNIKNAQLLAMPSFRDVPEKETSLDEISREILRAEQLRKVADDADRALSKIADQASRTDRELQTMRDRLDELKKQIFSLENAFNNITLQHDQEEKSVAVAKDLAKQAHAAIPDTESLRTRLGEIDNQNVQVRANEKYRAMSKDVAELGQQIKEQDTLVQNADQAKKDALAGAKFPVAGLGLTDNGVTFKGLPFAQAGSAEQVRVSVAIGIALNPTLKVLLIRNGNLLDKDSLHAVAAQAEVADMQVWMEFVSESKDGVAVMLEDGSVV